MKVIICFLSIFVLGMFHSGAQDLLTNGQEKDTLIVGYTLSAPFVYQQNDALDGLTFRLWKGITSEDNTHYILKYFPLEKLLKGLEDDSIQIGLSPLTITHERSKSIDFSVPYFVANSNGVIKELSFKQKFLGFFESISIVALLEVIGFLLLLLSIFGFLVWIFEKKNNDEFNKGIHGFWDGLWWSAVTMTTVGYGDKSPKTIGGRIIGLIWMFAAIILISSITAGITSSLTVKKLGYISGDYSYFDDVTIGVVKNSATEYKLKRMYSKNLKNYETFDDMMLGLKNDEVQVVSHDEPSLHYALNNGNDYKDYKLLDVKFNQSFYALGFSKKLSSTKKEALSRKVLKYMESTDWKISLSNYDLLESQNLILNVK